MHKLMQPKISRQRQQQREYLMTSSCDLEFLKQSTTIKVVNSRTDCFTICINSLEHAIQEQPRTTHRGMVRLNASTGHYSQCSGLCLRGIRQGGEITYTKKFLPKTSPRTTQRVMPHCSSLLADPASPY